MMYLLMWANKFMNRTCFLRNGCYDLELVETTFSTLCLSRKLNMCGLHLPHQVQPSATRFVGESTFLLGIGPGLQIMAKREPQKAVTHDTASISSAPSSLPKQSEVQLAR